MSGAGPHERIIYTSSLAPAPIGPYNQAVSVDDVLYISGQVGGDNDNDLNDNYNYKCSYISDNAIDGR